MANDLKRGIRVYLETSDYGKGMEQMSAATKKYESDLQGLTEQSKKMTAAGENSGKAWDDLQKQIKRTSDQVKKSQTTEADYAAKLKQTEKVLNNLSGSSYNELIEVQKKLQKEVKKGSDTVEEQNNKLSQLQRVNGQVAHSYTEMNSKIGAGSKGISGFLDNMSNMPGIVGSAGSSLQGLGMMFKTFIASPAMITIAAIVGLVAGLFSLAKNSMEFGKAMSNLSALTGAVGKDLDYLKEQAKSLGKQYGESAIKIVDAMKLVGSAKPELLSNVQALSQVTGEVIKLSKATGMDLGESTKHVTTIMNQFGLSALESERTVNTLAAGSKFGAVEVDYLGESISKVGTIAKSAGMTLEQTTAVMELFGEKGVRAETAGTGFKGVLVKLQADTKNYTNGIFDLNKAIDNNQKISGDNIALQKKFGTEFFGLAQILFQNKERFSELTKQVTGTTVAEEQMRVASDNLSGDMDKMTSSWGAFMLSLEDGKGPITTTFRTLVQWATDAVGALGSLTKNGAQKEADLIAESANRRLKSLKEEMSLSKDKVGVIDATITAEQHIYQRNNEKIKKLKAELVENDKKNFLMHSTQLDSSNKKEIESLQKSVNRSIAYVNAAAGLRAGLLKPVETKPGTTTKTGLTDEEQRKLTAAQKKKLDDAMKVLDNEFLESKNKRKKLHETDKATEESYNKDLLQLQIDYLEKKKKLYKVGSKEFNEIEGQLQDIRLKQTMDGNAALLKVANDTYKANQITTNKYESLEKTKLLKLLEDKILTKETYDTAILALEVTANERRLADAKVYAELLEGVNFESEEAKKTAIENANASIITAEEKLALSRKTINDKKLDADKEYYEKRKAFREKMGLDEENTIGGQYKKELEALKISLRDKIINEKEFSTQKIALIARTGAKYAQKAIEYSGLVSDAVSAYQQMETASLEAEKQKQLSAAGNNAEARAKIEADFAQKELDLKKKQSKAAMAIQIAQAVAAGALAIANIWATHAANPILAGILTALSAATSLIQIGTLVKQNAAIQATTLDSGSSSSDSSTTTASRVVTPQAAEGRWDVVGADDDRTYMNVPYRGVARTGIVTRPTLMGERGDELIVDNPTLRNIRMNEPWLINRIKHYRVQQRAGGNYSAVDNSASGGGSSPAYDNTAMLNALDRMIAFLQYLIDNGVKAPIVLSELEAKIALRDKSLKKGSI